MANTWQISEDSINALKLAAEAVEAELSDLRADWEAKSERWQEGEKGQEINQWIDELDDYYGELETALNELDGNREFGE